MANVLFRLRENKGNTPDRIILVYYFGANTYLFYPTGLKTRSKFWNKDKMRVRNVFDAVGKDVINDRLNQLQTAVENFVITETAKGNKVTKETMKYFLDVFCGKVKPKGSITFHEFIEDYISKDKDRVNPRTGAIISYKVQREHQVTYDYLKDFEKDKRDGRELNFDDIDLTFYNDFTAYLQDKGYKTNTIGHKIQTIKMWLNSATAQNINKNMQFKDTNFRAVKEEADTVYLSTKELKQLYDADLGTGTLAKVRDLFLLEANCGLRFSDMERITSDNIKDNNIYIEQKKTHGKVIIPILPMFAEIWQRYGHALPIKISNQKFNVNIKEACKKAGITETVIKHTTKGGVRISETYKKYELIGSHTARRSFATNLYLQGIPPLSIMKLTGHRSETAFLRYIRESELENANSIRETLMKLNK